MEFALMEEADKVETLMVGASTSVFMVRRPIVPKVDDTLVVDTLVASADAKLLTSAVAASVALEKSTYKTLLNMYKSLDSPRDAVDKLDADTEVAVICVAERWFVEILLVLV
jgi:hypothetical protein